ncbi:unnamed protein product [Discula destructiva]
MAPSEKKELTFPQSKELQRYMEGTLLKLEGAGLLQAAAADHIRIIVAEGIADSFGERYRTYPSAPRLTAVPIRRDAPVAKCPLATLTRHEPKEIVHGSEKGQNKAKVYNKNDWKKVSKQQQSVGVQRQAQDEVQPESSDKTTATSSPAKRVSAWMTGVHNASRSTASSKKSMDQNARLAANASLWQEILDGPIQSPGYKASVNSRSTSPVKGSDTLAPTELEPSVSNEGSAIINNKSCSNSVAKGSDAVPVKGSVNRKYSAAIKSAIVSQDAPVVTKKDIVSPKTPVFKHASVVNSSASPKMHDEEVDDIYNASPITRTPSPAKTVQDDDDDDDDDDLIQFSP